MRFSGCVPIGQQEQLALLLSRAREDAAQLKTALEAAEAARIVSEAAAEGRAEAVEATGQVARLLAEFETRTGQTGLQAAVAGRLIDWQTRLAELRVAEATQRRQVRPFDANTATLK
ncbi:unnamed protein product [Protopolystoma xenopodis]|uniref:Uncharacterized protein n=1 Tax=Protopolystoma xenopodis TaxID=117903 RepID=A0A3S5B6A0_9PLAT|nr:unnamed protein product [Protopolystoma xenopodis]